MDPLPDFLHHQDGEIRLAGSRIGLFHVVRAWKTGSSAEEIAREFPTVSLAHVEQVVAFYHARQAAVDEYVREYQAILDAQYAAGRKLTLAELRGRQVAPAGGRR